MLRVAFEERHFGPDGRQHLMRANNGPLARPDHPQQCTQLIAKTSVIITIITITTTIIIIIIIFIIFIFCSQETKQTSNLY